MRALALSSVLLLAAPAWAESPDGQPDESTVEAHAEDATPAVSDTELRRLLGAFSTQRDDLDLLRGQVDEMRSTIAGQQAEIEALRDTDARLDELLSPGDERTGFGNSVVVQAGELVEEATAFGEDVLVLGHVTGDATSFGGNVYIKHGGVVEGDAVSFGGRVITEDGAELEGNRLAMAAGANLMAMAPETSGFLTAIYNRLVFLLSFAGAGVLLVGLFPLRVGRIAHSLEEHPFRAAFAGTFATGFLLGAAGLFAITCLGLPVTAVLLTVLSVAWMMGFVGICQAVGDRLPFEQKQNGRWIAFLIGSLLVAFLTSLPFMGWLIVMMGSVLGIGAALSTRLGGR